MLEHEECVRALTGERAAILGYLRVLVRDPHLAEDLFQETCVVVFRKLDTFDESRSFSAWVRGIARNLARNAARKRKRYVQMPAPELVEAIESTYGAATSREGDLLCEKLDYLSVCLDTLGTSQRKLLRLRYADGLRLKDIARRLRRSAGAVQVALSRLRQALLQCIDRQAERRPQEV